MWSQAETMSVTAYMMLVLRVLHSREKYAARYSTSLNPTLDNKTLFERWNYCAGVDNIPAYHSVAQTFNFNLITNPKGEKDYV